MRIHGRTQLLIGALAAAFVVAVPGTAFAGHDLGIYKVEQQVDIDSDDKTVELACKGGDYALDGMWRIDHADYDEDDNYATTRGRAVDVSAAYPFDGPASGTRQDSYRFVFNKNTIGRAQAKVFLTCIAGTTEQSDGHTHAIDVLTVAPVNDDDGSYSKADICPTNSFVAQTGFKINDGVAGEPVPYVGHLSTSWNDPTGGLRGWAWVMDLSQDTPASVDFYASCVKRKLGPGGNEKHKLVYRLQGPETESVAATSTKTKRIACKSQYKAVVAGFAFDPGSMSDPNPEFVPALTVPQTWFLGMDPQPKNRDFRFLNSSGASRNVQIKALCLNYRTT